MPMKFGRIKTVSQKIKMPATPAPAPIYPSTGTGTSNRPPGITVTSQTRLDHDEEKCAKVKRFLGFGFLLAVLIVGWHLYGKKI